MTDADKLTFAAMYPVAPLDEIAAYFGFSVDTIYRRGHLAGLRRPPRPVQGSERMTLIVGLAARPQGFHSSDIEIDAHTTRQCCARLVARRELVAKDCGWRNTRYFTTQAAADAYAVTAPVATKQRAAEIHREGWAPDAPINWPVDAKGHPLWKLTIAPKPPERVLRTGTFFQYA